MLVAAHGHNRRLSARTLMLAIRSVGAKIRAIDASQSLRILDLAQDHPDHSLSQMFP